MKLSQGRWHVVVPKELKANLRFRRNLLERARTCQLTRDMLIKMCREDIIFFISVFIYQFNPKAKGDDAKVGPFIPWKFQEDALLDTPEITNSRTRKGIIWCYEYDRTAVVEKSREMGASWLFLIFQVWLCLFIDDEQVLNISRSADAVDDKSRNSLFAKIRFIHEHLPDWLKGEVVEQKMYFKYKRTNSEITGEASTGRSPAGARAGTAFIDEFPEIRDDTKVRQSTASVADSRFFNGTHTGVGTEFFRLTRSPEIVKIVMHWTEHPKKNKGLYSFDVPANKLRYWKYDDATRKITELEYPEYEYEEDYPFDRSGAPTGGPHPGLRSPWYDWKSNDIGTARGVAQELDIDPEGAGSQVFNALRIKQYKERYGRRPLWVGELQHDRLVAEPRRLVEMDGGHLQLWCHLENGKPRKGQYVVACDISYGTGTTPSVAAVYDVDRGEKVAQYVNDMIEPPDFAMLAVSLARLFETKAGDGALMVWESQGPGGNFGKRVIEVGYRHVYFDIDETNPMGSTKSERPGWFSNPRKKNSVIVDYNGALQGGLVVNRCEESLDECLSYVYDPSGNIIHSASRAKGADPSAVGGNHGDMVIADALGWMLCRKLNPESGVAPLEERVVEIAVGSFEWRMQWHSMQNRNNGREIWVK